MESLAAKEPILYRSTNDPRGKGKIVDFKYALFNPETGDDGLWIPERIPVLPYEVFRDMAKMSYAEAAFFTHRPWFTEEEISSSDLREMCERTYRWEVPIIHVGNEYMVDFGLCPSMSFKDGGTFGNTMYVKHFAPARYGIIDIDATSGDTGPSNAMGLYDSNIPVFVFFPLKNITELQKRQMTTLHKNIFPIALTGDYDSCAKMRDNLMVIFHSDPEIMKKYRFITGNSKSNGRFESMIAQWNHIASRVAFSNGGRPINAYPSIGNGSHTFSGLFAKRMGAPINQMNPISNDNYVFPWYIQTSDYKIMESIETDAKAIDIGNPKNVSRFANLFDGVIDTEGNVRKHPNIEEIRKEMMSEWIMNGEDLDNAMRVCHESGYTPCPQGGVSHGGMKKLIALEKRLMENPNVGTGTAHPAKFADVVERVLEFTPQVPEGHDHLFTRKERYETMGPDEIERAKEYILDTIKH